MATSRADSIAQDNRQRVIAALDEALRNRGPIDNAQQSLEAAIASAYASASTPVSMPGTPLKASKQKPLKPGSLDQRPRKKPSKEKHQPPNSDQPLFE